SSAWGVAPAHYIEKLLAALPGQRQANRTHARQNECAWLGSGNCESRIDIDWSAQHVVNRRADFDKRARATVIVTGYRDFSTRGNYDLCQRDGQRAAVLHQ